MKKTFSILLALVLVLALSATAFAANAPSISEGNATQEVTAQYAAGTVGDVAKVYYVTVAWEGNSNLMYSEGTAEYQWNPSSLQYISTGDNGAEWTGQAQYTVTVTNKSNAAVTAQTTWNTNTADGITRANCSFDKNGTVTVGSAAEGVQPGQEGQGQAKTGTITATINNVEGTISSGNAKVGTLTVTITAAD